MFQQYQIPVNTVSKEADVKYNSHIILLVENIKLAVRNSNNAQL